MSTIHTNISKSAPTTYWAVAILKYRPKCDDELCLTTQQAVEVLSVDPQVSGSNGWWVGRDCYGNVGVFPANYVQLQESVTEAGNECLRNSSFELSSSLQEYNSSSFYVDSTLVSSHIAGHSVATDSSLGTGGESDGDVRVRQQTKLESLAGALSHLRLIKYEDIALGESIGAGSFGTVYRGTWEGKMVALKVYHQASSQIQREALNLDQLSHRNVVQFFGIWETQANFSHLPALVMEFAHGGALHTVVRRRPAVHCATLADWALQVAEGMRYLHERVGLVHRDLKTANILIREPLIESPGPDDLTGKTLIISDFGMSCHTDAIGSRVSGVGTAAYAAPEVICMEVFSLASDVWSYGVVLWEIFAMLEPFKEFDRAQQLVNIGRYRQKLFIPRSEAGFPEIIGSLLTRCWADEPEERPAFCDIYNYLLDAQNDSFFSISTEEFIARQDAWMREISDDAELSLLSESCSSEASSPLRRQNEFLQQENAKMRDALQALKQNEARYRGTIAGLQKDNQILSDLVANTLFKNTAALVPPAPRKKPFMYNIFRRNESKSSTVNSAATAVGVSVLSPSGDSESSITTTTGDPNVTSINVAAAGAAAAINADRPPRDYSPVVKSTGRRHGKNTRKSSPGISYPSEVRHVVHVPRNLVFESSNELYPPIYRSNFSPGSSNTFVAPSVPSPTSPTAFGGGGGSTSSSSYLRPRTDSQSTDPVLLPSSYIFSPTDDTADNPPQFTFLLTQNKLNGNGGGAATLLSRLPPSNFQHKHHQHMSKSGETGGLTSYKSAPELCEQVNCSKARLSTLEGRHTVSRDCAFDGASATSDRKPTNSSTSAANGGVSTSKRHRIGLSTLFHTSRSKLNSSSGKPSSPSGDSITLSPLPPPIPTGTALDLSPTSTSSALPPLSPSTVISSTPSIIGVSQSNNGRSSSSNLPANKHKPLSTTPRRLLLHKLFQTDRSRQRRLSGGGSRKSSGKKQQQQQQQQLSQRQSRRDSTSPNSSTILPEDNPPSSSDVESKKLDSESPSSTYIPPSVQMPPLPPYLLRQTNQIVGPRRRLLDIIPPPPAHMPAVTSTFPIPRPCTLIATDAESKGSVGVGPRRRPFVPRLKSQSLDVLYHSEEPPPVLIASEETEQQRQPLASASKEAKSADGDEDDEGDSGPAPVNPVPLALWSALQIASIAPLLLDCQAIAPARVYSHTAPQSAPFARVTFSPFASDEPDQEADILGKAQSCLGRISSTLALTTAAGASISADRSRQPTRQQWNTQRELSAPAPSSSPWQRKLNQLPPVYYSPPPGNGNDVGNSRETCCKCVCHSAGGGARSRHSSSTTTNSSQSPSPWLPVENPVALSRDAYLKVTQDGYLNCSTVDETLDDDLVDLVDDGNDIANSVHCASSILLGRSLRGFSSSSPLFSPTSFFQQHQQPNQQTSKNGHGGGVAADNGDQVIILPEEEEEGRGGELEEVGEPSFGAGEAAEDTATLYEEFESLSAHQGLYKTAFDGMNGEEWKNGCPIPEADALICMLSLTDRPTQLPSYPCRRRKAFRLKGKPEGLLSSPEEDSATGASEKSVVSR